MSQFLVVANVAAVAVSELDTTSIM